MLFKNVPPITLTSDSNLFVFYSTYPTESSFANLLEFDGSKEKFISLRLSSEQLRDLFRNDFWDLDVLGTFFSLI